MKTQHVHTNQGSRNRNTRYNKADTVNYSFALRCYLVYLGPCRRNRSLREGGNLIALGWRPDSLRGGNLIAFGWQPYSLRGGNLIACGWQPDSLFIYGRVAVRGQDDQLGGERGVQTLGSPECRPRQRGQASAACARGPGHRRVRHSPVQPHGGRGGRGTSCGPTAWRKGGCAEGGIAYGGHSQSSTAREQHHRPRPRLGNELCHHPSDRRLCDLGKRKRCKRTTRAAYAPSAASLDPSADVDACSPIPGHFKALDDRGGPRLDYKGRVAAPTSLAASPTSQGRARTPLEKPTVASAVALATPTRPWSWCCSFTSSSPSAGKEGAAGGAGRVAPVPLTGPLALEAARGARTRPESRSGGAPKESGAATCGAGGCEWGSNARRGRMTKPAACG